MKHHEITRPIGLEAPCQEIDGTCGKAELYKCCGLRPKHLIVPLDPGAGRTTLVEYLTERYKEAGVLPFAGGLDDYIEVTLDGTLPQLKRAFAAIDAAAVYANEYGGVVGMDVSAIAAHMEETQFTLFLQNCKRVCDHACVIFFVRSAPSRGEERLMEKLGEQIPNLRRLAVEPYTREDLRELIFKAVTEHGVAVEHEESFRAALDELVREFQIASVKDTAAAAEAMVRFADFSGFTPTVDENSLKEMAASWRRRGERSGVK